MYAVLSRGGWMPFEEEPSKKETPEQEPGENGIEGQEVPSIFNRVNNFFGWLGQLINEQAQLDAHLEDVPHPPLKTVHQISKSLQTTSEVIANAERICENLEEVKKRLTCEFGASASSFISKCIDPMIEHARALIYALNNADHEANPTNGVLEQAIESVELYSQFRDEKKLKKKIVQIAQGFIKQSIDKDMEVLANYKSQALNHCKLSDLERQEAEFHLDRFLYPIVSELLGMAESRVETDDLHAFFVWKTNVDERRNSLVELGLLTIDAIKGDKDSGMYITDEEGDEIVLEEPFSDLVKHKIEDSSLAMSFLATLEDRVHDIANRLEVADPEDSQYVDEVSQLLEYLKVDAERLASLSAHTKHILDNFKALRESILSAEAEVNRLKSR